MTKVRMWPARALVKPCSARFAQGLTSQRLGAPTLEVALRQHKGYVEALRQAGLEVIELPADEHPDSCFVEDMALVAEEFVVFTRPGHPRRLAEAGAVQQTLRELLPSAEFFQIEEPGCLDGGDVLRMDSRWYVGLSGRTNADGVTQLQRILARYGHSCQTHDAGTFLHLKTAVSRLDPDTVIAHERLARSFRALGYRVLEVQAPEWHAANVVCVEKHIVMPAGYDRVEEQISAWGLLPVPVPLSEFAKQDGGATCLSILLPAKSS